MDFEIIKRAGLNQREFATLCGVSRVTANMWATGKMAPHRLHKDRIAAILGRIGVAIDNAHLPLPAGVAKHLRAEQIGSILDSVEV